MNNILSHFVENCTKNFTKTLTKIVYGGEIKNGLDESYIGCSTEGHVSHILSERLSSRPLGWCYEGVDDMSRLRAFRANGGDIKNVVKKQKTESKRLCMPDNNTNSKEYEKAKAINSLMEKLG